MNHFKIFNAISEELGPQVALHAVQIMSINLTIDWTDEFIDNPTTVIKQKAKELLWELSESDFEFSFKVYQCIHDWDCRQVLQGLGGCKPKTFKELLEDS